MWGQVGMLSEEFFSGKLFEDQVTDFLAIAKIINGLCIHIGEVSSLRKEGSE